MVCYEIFCTEAVYSDVKFQLIRWTFYLLIQTDSLVVFYRRVTQTRDGMQLGATSVVLVQYSDRIIA